MALGDIVERVLRLFGITKERVQAATGTQDCGCQKRQAALNKAGYKIQGSLIRRWTRLKEIATFSDPERALRFRLARHYFGKAVSVLFYGR